MIPLPPTVAPVHKQLASTRARIRWHLALTLRRNRQFTKLRKHQFKKDRTVGEGLQMLNKMFLPILPVSYNEVNDEQPSPPPRKENAFDNA
jgi:hypothetical protein